MDKVGKTSQKIVTQHPKATIYKVYVAFFFKPVQSPPHPK